MGFCSRFRTPTGQQRVCRSPHALCTPSLTFHSTNTNTDTNTNDDDDDDGDADGGDDVNDIYDDSEDTGDDNDNNDSCFTKVHPCAPLSSI